MSLDITDRACVDSLKERRLELPTAHEPQDAAEVYVGLGDFDGGEDA